MQILIVFGSLLGKTKRTAVLIAHTLKNYGFDVTVKDVRSTSIEELDRYEFVILGSSTWDDGMLQFDFRPFNSELSKKDFNQKKFAAFALGSFKYPHPFASAKIIEETLQKSNAKLLLETAKFDLDHDDPENKCDNQIIEWTEGIVVALKRI